MLIHVHANVRLVPSRRAASIPLCSPELALPVLSILCPQGFSKTTPSQEGSSTSPRGCIHGISAARPPMRAPCKLNTSTGALDLVLPWTHSDSNKVPLRRKVLVCECLLRLKCQHDTPCQLILDTGIVCIPSIMKSFFAPGGIFRGSTTTRLLLRT